MKEDILDDVLGYSLDLEQRAVVLDESSHLLVIAGAGCGKTLTLVGKIRYLVEKKKIACSEILCISFTNASVLSLRQKLQEAYGYTVDVFTFHKLSLEILAEKKEAFSIVPSDFLEYVVKEYFYGVIFQEESQMLLVLRYFRVIFFSSISMSYQSLLQKREKEVDALIRLICQFLRLWKGRGGSFSDFLSFFKQNRSSFFLEKRKQTFYFLHLALSLARVYEEELSSSGQIDFDDMILLATKKVQKKGISKRYRYVLIDEYQDTSWIRFRLVQAILNNTGAKLLVVGDDYQSIYRFSGCDLSMFLEFSTYFPDASILKITQTYRNSQELIFAAGKFIQKNRRQIPKELVSSKHLSHPIEVYYTKNPSQTLKNLLLTIDFREIFLLGRNQADIFPFFDEELIKGEGDTILYLPRPDLCLSFLTVHRAKGLEAEAVILLHVVDQFLGFPNQIPEERVLRFVLSSSHYYPYEEERRLFYVALTRTKNKVYILSDSRCPSIFLKELPHDFTVIHI